MSQIHVHKLWKSYGDNIVLENLDLTINDGEFVTIVGASGCGKTTFLRLILGEETPTRGYIEIDSSPLEAEPSRDRGIVFQRYSVFPHLTVIGNVLLSLELRHAKVWCRSFAGRRKQHLQQCEKMLDRVGLTHALQQYPAELSGGMQQRLAICQALIAAPKILLLDEPFGALDPGIRNDMHALVRELHQELGLTILMITHDISEGFNLGTRLLVFDKIRNDPHEPERYGANVTYDLSIGERRAPAEATLDRQSDSSTPPYALDVHS